MQQNAEKENAQNPLISVIIPVYNVEKYLARCLDSILQNTYRNLEVICVNDGSKDGSLAILEEYAVRDARIVVISQENRGQSAARNNGMDHAHGEFIAFIDSDDYIHSRYFEILLKPVLNEGADVSAAWYKTVTTSDTSDEAFGEVSFRRLENIDAIFANSIVRNTVCGKIFRRSFIQNERFTEGIKFEDKCLACLLFAKRADPVVYYAEEEIYYYRVNPTSTMNTIPYIKMLDTVDIFLPLLGTAEILHKRQLLDMAVRVFVVARYYTPKPTDEEKQRIKDTAQCCLAAVSEFAELSLKKRLYLKSLIKFPMIYKVGKKLKSR